VALVKNDPHYEQVLASVPCPSDWREFPAPWRGPGYVLLVKKNVPQGSSSGLQIAYVLR
jgi:hypothetical protein